MSCEKYEVEVFHKGIGDYKEEPSHSLVVETGTTVTHRNPVPDLYFPVAGGYCRIGTEKRFIPIDGEALELKAEVRIVIRRKKEEIVEFRASTRLPWYRRLQGWLERGRLEG